MHVDSKVDVDGLLNLCSISNIGPLRIRALMARFKTPTAILNASMRQLIEVPGVDYKIAKIEQKSRQRLHQFAAGAAGRVAERRIPPGDQYKIIQ